MTTTLILALAIVILANYCLYKNIKELVQSTYNNDKNKEKSDGLYETLECIYGNTLTIMLFQFEQRRQQIAKKIEKYEEDEMFEECQKLQDELKSIEETMRKIQEHQKQ